MKGKLEDYIHILQKWERKQPGLDVVIHTEPEINNDGPLEMHIYIKMKEAE